MAQWKGWDCMVEHHPLHGSLDTSLSLNLTAQTSLSYLQVQRRMHKVDDAQLCGSILPTGPLKLVS